MSENNPETGNEQQQAHESRLALIRSLLPEGTETPDNFVADVQHAMGASTEVVVFFFLKGYLVSLGVNIDDTQLREFVSQYQSISGNVTSDSVVSPLTEPRSGHGDQDSGGSSISSQSPELSANVEIEHGGVETAAHLQGRLERGEGQSQEGSEPSVESLLQGENISLGSLDYSSTTRSSRGNPQLP